MKRLGIELMSPKTIEQLQKELLKKRSILTAMQKGVRKEELVGADECDIEESWFGKERISQHFKVELKQIETALVKMDQGSFGECQLCEEEIPVKRLRVRPDATYCLSCQEIVEHEMGAHARIPGPRMTGPTILQ